LTPDAWANSAAQMMSLRRAVADGGTVDITLLALNASHVDAEYAVPNPELQWHIELDTANPDRDPAEAASTTIQVAAHSVVLLAASVSL